MTRNSLPRKFTILASLALGMGTAIIGSASPAAAQTTYVCPPGYYFLGGYGCYPWGGYSYYAPPPPAYYYPPAPYYYATPGLSFRFDGRDRGRDRDHDRGDHGRR